MLFKFKIDLTPYHLFMIYFINRSYLSLSLSPIRICTIIGLLPAASEKFETFEKPDPECYPLFPSTINARMRVSRYLLWTIIHYYR